MKIYFVSILLLTAVVVASVIYGFTLVGLPWESAKIEADRQMLVAVARTASHIYSDYRLKQKLPESLDDINPELTPFYQNQKIQYTHLGQNKFQLCFELEARVKNPISLDAIDYTSDTINRLMDTTAGYEPGNLCLAFIAGTTNLRPNGSDSKPENVLSDYFQDFETWEDGVPTFVDLVSGEISRTTKAYSQRYALEFPAGISQSVIATPKLKVGTNRKIHVTLMHETASDCKDCFFVAINMVDQNQAEITQGVEGCGRYNPYLKGWQQHFNGPTEGFEKITTSCTLPEATNTYHILIGVWNQIDEAWLLDYVHIKPDNVALHPLPENTARECPIALVDGVCNLNNCSYTYPNDIYSRGTVTVGNFYRNLGQPTGTFYDECSADGTQVTEMQCSGNPNDPYNLGKATYDCPKGCVSGACLL